MTAGFSGPRTVLVTSTLPDRLNSNVAIRGYAAAGFRATLPEAAVHEAPLDVAGLIARETKPDIILAIGSLGIDGDGLRELRHAADNVSAPLALWVHDDPYEFDYAFRGEAVADFIFTNDAWSLFHYTHPKVTHLPLAGCRKTHYRPIIAGPTEIEVFFCGVAHPNRVSFFRNATRVLSKYSCAVYGSGWPSDLTYAANRRLSPAEVADTAHRSLTTLNIYRDHNIANRRYDLPPATPGPRTFEIALAGSAQLYLVNSLEIVEYFLPDSEMLLFDSITELEGYLQRAREEPQHFLQIAENAQRRALNCHCYEHRVSRILETVFATSSVAGPKRTNDSRARGQGTF